MAQVTAPAGAPVSRVTSAESGSAAAAGVTAQNAVVNNSTGVVQVAGQNHGRVSVQSSNQTLVVNAGVATAVSGEALAKDSGAAITARATAAAGTGGTGTAGMAVATGVAGATGRISGDVSEVGPVAVSNVAGSIAANMSPSGASGTPVSLAVTQHASVQAVGTAQAASGAACASPPCTHGSAGGANGAAGTGTDGLTQAASGAATAYGLVAQNAVVTNASAAVRVGGNNYGVIQVIIDTVTRVLNLGDASATSGRATAGGAAGGPAPSANGAVGTAPGVDGAGAGTGSARAVGAQVQNDVQLRSSANVRVSGNNYDPISLFLDLATTIYNRGVAAATSGHAAATGGGNGGAQPGAAGASSGSAAATGLVAQNVVGMWASAMVDIVGDNFAAITVRIRLTTDVVNEGAARATSGDAQAAAASTGGVQGAAPAAVTGAGSGTGTGGAVQSAASVPSGSAAAARQLAQSTGVTEATSGAAQASGAQSSVALVNVQTAAALGVDDPSKRVATNNASQVILVEGHARATSGEALVGPTATPTPTPRPRGATVPELDDRYFLLIGTPQPAMRTPTAVATVPALRQVQGYMARVRPWNDMDGPLGRPPQPNQRLKAVKPVPSGGVVDVSTWNALGAGGLAPQPDGAQADSSGTLPPQPGLRGADDQRSGPPMPSMSLATSGPAQPPMPGLRGAGSQPRASGASGPAQGIGVAPLAEELPAVVGGAGEQLTAPEVSGQALPNDAAGAPASMGQSRSMVLWLLLLLLLLGVSLWRRSDALRMALEQGTARLPRLNGLWRAGRKP